MCIKFLKSLFSDKTLAEDIIRVMEKSYWRTRKEKPGEDEHYYLATALFNRMKARKLATNQSFYFTNSLPPWFRLEDKEKQEKEREDSFILNQTYLFAVLEPPESIRALALYVVYKEIPEAAHYFEKEYNKIMLSVIKMQEDGTLFDLYKKKNPKIAKQVEDIK